MLEDKKLIDYLREIENTTDLNGSFFVNVEDHTLIESTIPFHVPEDILWELSVLRDTFQQFGNGFKHGDLQELMIEGDKGYILFYNVPPHLILLAMGTQDINLSYVKLALIDILKDIRAEIFEMGDTVLQIPAKGFGKIGERIPIKPSEIAPAEPVVVKPIEAEIAPVEPVVAEPIEAEITPVEPVVAEPIEAEQDINSMIDSIASKSEEERYVILKKIFNALKAEISTVSGNKISELLELLKDSILENLGTSLALFDLSKCSRDLSKIHDVIAPESIKKYQDRIDNWSSRIVK